MVMKTIGILLAVLMLVGCQTNRVVEKETSLLQTVKERGYIVCGVNAGLPGFASEDAEGNWSGLDVDFCRAVSAAVFGDADKVEYLGLNAAQRFPTLASGSIDILSRNTTWTISRDVNLMFEFAGVSYYDGQGF
jgi:general L-amino acid transport system substrate-binding protein